MSPKNNKIWLYCEQFYNKITKVVKKKNHKKQKRVIYSMQLLNHRTKLYITVPQ